MIRDIHEKLLALTDEEKQILNGEIEVDRSLYTDNGQFIIDSDKLLSQGELIDIRKHTRFIKFPEHKHNYIEFNYVYQGELKEIIDNKEINLKKGELIFLNQYINHELEICSENDISINFIIRPEFFDYILSLLDNENIISRFLITTLYTDYKEGEYLYFKVAEDEKVQEILEKIIIELYTDGMMSRVTIKLLVGLLFVELVKTPECIEIYSVDNYDKMIIIQVFKYIHEFYKEGTLLEIAEKLKQPDYKLSKLIKKHTQMTFKELIQEKRLSRAIELLKARDLSVVEIMQKVGYENPTYFYKIFKEKYGVTPMEYRKKDNK
ncbi:MULTISPECIES: AraC family transcriptional regulator [Clostridium]|uniref:Helix-turn-helix transcriptional regulator n=1 Tax=Clostridium cibarium TaxID=2762247 RepID=A0ABR8PSZ5_9CLOT|nr:MULTISPECIES: AraC family transcriptional regulator [Clostridium]MBD7911298.1 helix-turn-helix transcriptional regulator [Clostridium cibarium]